jgi:hypothetical protein
LEAADFEKSAAHVQTNARFVGGVNHGDNGAKADLARSFD